jgi:hypothetical protein
MNETEHVFPLPELEQHKLDELKENIVHPVATRMRRRLSANTWTAIVAALAAGLFCGLICGRRH